jgi:GNAT superfamily N-acetyltransferase
VPETEIVAGYQPGLIGRIVEMHARFYARHAGFGVFFESQVAAGLAEFVTRLDESRNRIWAAVDDDRIVGSITIDGQDLAPAAHLRWFVVDDSARGLGVGGRLLSAAVGFCDGGGFAETHLWTFAGLDAARRLYEREGFQVAEQRPGEQWGKTVLEQRFVRPAFSPRPARSADR